MPIVTSGTDHHFDLVMVWDNLGGAVRIRRNGLAQVVDPSAGTPVTVTQDGQSTSVVRSDAQGRVTFVAQQGIVKLVADGLAFTAVSAEQATAGADNAAMAQAAQVAAEAARDDAQAAAANANAVDVRAYGAKLDGVTDDTAAFQAALNAASASGVNAVTWVGRAAIAGSLSLSNGVALRGAGQRSVLVQTGSPSALVTATGSVGSSVALTADAARGATTLSLGTAGLNAGDVLLLTDTASFAGTDATYKSGELVSIKSVDSGSQVTVTSPVRGSFGTASGAYTTGNGAAVKKVTMVSGVVLQDFTFEGDANSTTTLFLASYCDAPSVRNVRIRKGGSIGYRFHTCRSAEVLGGSVSDLTDDIGAGQAGYAVAVSGACSNTTVTGLKVSRVRHAFTTIGGADGIPRGVNVTGCVISSASTAALDTHAAGDDILFADNVIYGGGNGISIRSRNTTVSGNRIRYTGSHGITLAEDALQNVTVKGNVIADVVGAGHGIVSTACAGLEVSGNSITRCGADGIRVDVGSTGVEITNNSVRNVGMALAGRTGIVAAAGGTPASGWIVQRNTVGNDASTGSTVTAVAAGAGLTGSFVLDNRAFGSFSGTVFDTTTNTARRNERIDQAPAAVTGSRGGNAALAALLTQLASQGLITDSTTA